MAIYKLKKQDGWVKVAPGACQIFLKNIGAKVGIIHNDVAPAFNSEYEYYVNSKDITTTLGKSDCYIKVFSAGTVEISATEI
jgi:hypothetical protein